jgi:hypothetical protein
MSRLGSLMASAAHATRRLRSEPRRVRPAAVHQRRQDLRGSVPVASGNTAARHPGHLVHVTGGAAAQASEHPATSCAKGADFSQW